MTFTPSMYFYDSEHQIIKSIPNKTTLTFFIQGHNDIHSTNGTLPFNCTAVKTDYVWINYINNFNKMNW